MFSEELFPRCFDVREWNDEVGFEISGLVNDLFNQCTADPRLTRALFEEVAYATLTDSYFYGVFL